ncbi:MAG TPA: glycoside hydrolase family 9 protein [Bacteroidota bacterium]|nr:glycoside hydrolase family 9 protein [Bacteroidota bacterium]
MHRLLLFLLGSLIISSTALCQKLKLNESEYFETPGFNVLVFSNQYTGFFFDEKTAGVEFIHHGVRTVTNGAVRLRPTPEQWDQIPMVTKRTVDKEHQTIEVSLHYKEYEFDSRVKVTPKGDGFTIAVVLDKPLPKSLEGKAGFNLEFLPSAYFEKTFLMDGKPGIFPFYPNGPVTVKPLRDKVPQFGGHSTFDDRGRNEYVDPEPIAEGHMFALAPEDPERFVTIASSTGSLLLYDGRNNAQNGWFVVRTMIPSNKTGTVVEWTVTPHAIENWKRKPIVSYSQAGYMPDQKKVAVVELDKNDTPLPTVSLYKVEANGSLTKALTGSAVVWGKYFRYKYLTFDFSAVKNPGVYMLEYGDQRTQPFPINSTVYDNSWQLTLDVYLPVQMDHMLVNEAYRVWHGRPYKDDCLQAPVNHQHFDGYRMGPTTETKYASLEHIPGMAVGGWFDAGDFDIQTGSHNAVVSNLSQAWTMFHLTHDETFIDQKNNFVDIHRPDGVPDLLQQIEHGTLQLVAQQKNIGHAVVGIIVPNLHQYHHLGDAINETDNLPYNSKLKPYETDGVSSGTLDDRWAFTNRQPWLNYGSCAALAEASRALKGYNDQLAEEALHYAIGAWNKEHDSPVKMEMTWGDSTWIMPNVEVPAALQLYISTKEEKYGKRFLELMWDDLDKNLEMSIISAVRAIPYFPADYKTKLTPYVVKYKNNLEALKKENPFGIPFRMRNWGGNQMIVQGAITNYYLAKAFPEIISPEATLNGLNYIFGCHPYSNISFVSGVGTHSKKVAYGNNRANFSFIPGGVVPGLLMLNPDFPENKEDWPFFWGENEYVIDIASAYIFLANAAIDLTQKK